MSAPALFLDVTTNPPSLSVTFIMDDVSDAVAAMNAAIKQATDASAIKGAKQVDPEDAGHSAFVQKLIPLFYKQIELTQKGATLSDEDIAAQIEARKTALDAEAEALLSLRPVIKIKS